MLCSNRIIVRTETELNDSTGLIGLDGKEITIVNSVKSEEGEIAYFNKEENARIYAEVVEVPKKLDLEYQVNDVGFPYPRPHNPGMFYDRYYRSKEVQEMLGARYYPGVYEAAVFKITKPEVSVGDRVYFHFHSLCEENFIKEDETGKYYAIDYLSIFCIAKGDSITPISGYVLCEPYYEGAEDIEIPELQGNYFAPLPKTMKGKIGKFGLITEVHEKPQYLEAVVSYIGIPVGFDEINIQAGDRILYTKESDFENEIEGRKFFVMKQHDIFAVKKDEVVTPVGKWMEVELIEEDKAIIWDNPKRKPRAKIIKVGNAVEDVSVGDVVAYERGCFQHHVGGSSYIRNIDCFFKEI